MAKKEKMQAQKVTIIPIYPCTHVRSTQGDRWLFAVDDEKIAKYDQKKLMVTGKRGGNMRRKMQLEKYNAYKQEIRHWAEKTGFKMPLGYFAIWFCVPFPKSWEPRKTKCREMLGKPHQNTPDCDNFLKAFFDAIMPRKNKTKGEKGGDDRKIHCYTAFKIWVQPDGACIRIVEYEKDEFMTVFTN